MGPLFTAYDAEGFRIPRLKEAHIFAKGYASLVARGQNIDELVTQMHDHKGVLRMTWRVTPCRDLRQAFGMAWESVGEDSACVEHRVDLLAPVQTLDEWERAALTTAAREEIA